MSIDMAGFEDCISVLDTLGNVGDNIKTNSVKNVMQSNLSIIQRYAPKGQNNAKDYLKVGKIRRYRSGSVWGGMGIDETNWEKCKSIYFQHYGYHNWGRKGRYKGKYVARHQGWFDRAINDLESPVLNQLEQEITREIDKILK